MPQSTTNQQLSPADARASLGMVTQLMQQQIPQGQQMQPPLNPAQAQETASSEEKTKEDPQAELQLKINEQLDAIRKELKEDHQREIDQLKSEITQALNEPDETQQTA